MVEHRLQESGVPLGLATSSQAETDLIIAKSHKLQAALKPHLGRLPIFPLSQVQLFPGAMLPLYVFEPRYREMTAWCLENGGLMAIASLRPGYEADYQGRPPVRRIAGLGKIVAHRLNPDGTYNILLRGIARVGIVEELPPLRMFREVRARLLRDHWPESFDADTARQTMVALTERLAAMLAQKGEPLRALCSSETRARKLVDVLSAALVAPPLLRQRLLEVRNVLRRVDMLTSELARLIAHLQKPSESGAN